MNYNFYILEQTRSNILNAIKEYSIEQLNTIPDGFNNNLIWNFGHVVVTQQLLCYGLSGLPMHLDKELINKYRKGSKPMAFVDVVEFELLKEKAFQLIEQTKTDYAKGIFKSYKSYTTSFNVTINSVEEAIAFNNVHEGLHFGSVLALRKLI
ncbi:MAG: DinB family protein [Saprospiraceae bacterium]